MGDLQTRIKNLSATAELLVVVITAFGFFIFSSVAHVVRLFTSGGTNERWPSTEADLIEMLVFEAFVLVILGHFLRVRGWTLAQLGLDPSWGHDDRAFKMGVALRAAQGVVLALVAGLSIRLPKPGRGRFFDSRRSIRARHWMHPISACPRS
jgi:hypothetical protein